VVLAGAYFVALGGACFAAPARASRFLLGFASSAQLHFFELMLRFLVGAAFIQRAPEMLFETAVAGFGWVLVTTTAVMLFVPWRLHRDLAQRTVPSVVHHLTLVGIASFLIGTFVLACAVAPLARPLSSLSD